MNVDNGRIYQGETAIKVAQARGENVVPVSAEVARTMQVGQREIQHRMNNLARTRPDLTPSERLAIASEAV